MNKRKQDEVDSELKTDKERKARLAREKREKVMAQMSQMQKSFIKKYENFLSLEDDKERLILIWVNLFEEHKIYVKLNASFRVDYPLMQNL